MTGQWAKKAYQEAARYGEANVVASMQDKTFTYIPELDPAKIRQGRRLLSTSAITTPFTEPVSHELPDTGKVPLVADMSSCILSANRWM